MQQTCIFFPGPHMALNFEGTYFEKLLLFIVVNSVTSIINYKVGLTLVLGKLWVKHYSLWP